jgi:hypothetical protein
MPHVTAKIAVFRMVAYLMVVAYCLWNQIGMHHTLWLILIPETISNFAYHFAALWRVGGKLEDLKDFFVGPIFLNLIFGAILFGGITLIDYLGFANYQSFLGLGLITFVGYGFIVLPKIQEDVRKIRIL